MLEEKYESFALARRSLRLAWCTCPVGTIQFDGSVLRCGFRRLWDRPSRRRHRLAHHSGVRCYGSEMAIDPNDPSRRVCSDRFDVLKLKLGSVLCSMF